MYDNAKNEKFVQAMMPIEFAAFNAIKKVCENFLGNHKAKNYLEIVEEMLKAFEAMNIHISLKIHFLNSHMDFFPENMGACSDEHGERFHQEIKEIEKAYKKQSKPQKMLGTYCWTITRHEAVTEFRRQIKKESNVFVTGRKAQLAQKPQPKSKLSHKRALSPRKPTKHTSIKPSK